MSRPEFAHLEGVVGAPFPMRVELGKVREFALATGAASSAHLAEPDPLAPPTFLMTAAFWRGPEHRAWGDSGPEPARVLHGEQEFVFHGTPLRAGAALVGQQRVDRVYEKPGRHGVMCFIELVTEFLAAEALVAESRTTVIVMPA